MSQVIVADVAAPFFLSQTGNILVFVSIIPVEMLVICLCLKSSEIAIDFSRLFVAVLVANIATSIVGIPLLFNDTFFIDASVTINLLISFLLSFSIESVIYGIVFKAENVPRGQIVLFSCLSNLASYIILYLAIISS
ncbi:hypothetical protein [Microcoleus sp.]|uniref:hypothetical protein n=1 Tax=Microcoleus sp. TaxID=44472 RepID=UPI00403EDB8A